MLTHHSDIPGDLPADFWSRRADPDGYANRVLTTVLDLADYIRMIHGDGRAPTGRWVVQPDSLARMFVRQNESVPLDFNLRMGLVRLLSDRRLDYAGRHCWNNGATPVFRSHLEILLDRKLGVVLIFNTSTAGAVLPLLARRARQLALEEKTGLAPVPVPTPECSPVVSWSKQSLEAVRDLSRIYFGNPWDSPETTTATVRPGRPYSGPPRVSGRSGG